MPVVTPECARLSGIVDLVVDRPDLAGLVIEVDSANKACSVDKPPFAQRAGGPAGLRAMASRPGCAGFRGACDRFGGLLSLISRW